MALWTRRKSTCRRTTSSGSVTLMTTGSHVTNEPVQAMSGMWTVRGVTSVGIALATCASGRLFPGYPKPPTLPGSRKSRRLSWVVRLRVSALVHPAERRLGRGRCRRLMLAVAPSAARALFVVTLPARDADHGLYCAASRRPMVPVCRGPPLARAASGGVRAAHATAPLGRTLVLVQAAPRSVLLGPRDRVI
jgi:hypothetical protein